MKIYVLIVVFSLLILLAPYGMVYGQPRIEYSVQVTSDGSAVWIIKQTGTDIQFSPDTLDEFQNKVTSLVESAKNETGRDMATNATSITFTPSGAYVVIEYRFYWVNFSEIQDSKIIVGDVFQVKKVFSELYGDGEVHITYPPEYVVETVLPPPNEYDTSSQTLVWIGTLNFNEGQPSIILKEKSASTGLVDLLGQNMLVIISIIMVSSGLSLGLYTFKRYRRGKNENAKKPESLGFPRMESDEDKIVNLLKSSGGSMYQSAITDQCKFSKAKTSQLLAAMENNGIVKRHKKGRDKIVVLADKGKK